jgi:hypothetical protein
MRPYVRFIRFSVEPHPLAPSFLAHSCYNSSMDANLYNQPTPAADPPHQGVVIEDYRGPLLTQTPRRSGGSTSLTSGSSAPMFAASPLPEWLAEQPQPRQRTHSRLWPTRMFRSDADETLNTAKRGLGWMLVALLGFGLVIGTLVLSNLNPQFVQTTSFAMIGWTAPLLTLIFLPAALLGSLHSLREAHFSSYPHLVRRISLISLCGELIMVAAIVYSIIWFIVQLDNCLGCLVTSASTHQQRQCRPSTSAFSAPILHFPRFKPLIAPACEALMICTWAYAMRPYTNISRLRRALMRLSVGVCHAPLPKHGCLQLALMRFVILPHPTSPAGLGDKTDIAPILSTQHSALRKNLAHPA